MILHDKPRPVQFRRFKTTAHMMSTLRGAAGTAELDTFARRIGLSVAWRQNSGTATEHYDLFDGAIARAAAAGSVEVTGRELVERVSLRKRGSPPYTAAQWVQSMALWWPSLYGHRASGPPPEFSFKELIASIDLSDAAGSFTKIQEAQAAREAELDAWRAALTYVSPADYTEAQWASTVYRVATALFARAGSGHSWLSSGVPAECPSELSGERDRPEAQSDRNLPRALDLKALEAEFEPLRELREQLEEHPPMPFGSELLTRSIRERRFWFDASFLELGTLLVRAELERNSATIVDPAATKELLTMLELYATGATELTYTAEDFGKTNSTERARGLIGLLRHPKVYVREGVLLGLAGHLANAEIRSIVQAFADDVNEMNSLRELATELLEKASGSAETPDEANGIHSGPAGTAGP